MAGWTDVPAEAGVSWITVSSYAYGENEIEGHLPLLPGDAVVPTKQTEVG